jgi:hypothetical protein
MPGGSDLLPPVTHRHYRNPPAAHGVATRPPRLGSNSGFTSCPVQAPQSEFECCKGLLAIPRMPTP